MPRRTLANVARVSGVGLHTGTRATAVCRPADPGTGIVFHRTDKPASDAAPVRASVHEVTDVERRTSLGRNGNTVHTVEHLLAAAAALEIDDLVVELDGPELPIGDGSFAPFVDALASAGTVEHVGECTRYEVTSPFELYEGVSRYQVAPSRCLRLEVAIDWRHPLVGKQTGDYEVNPDTFARELASARTFGLEREVVSLQARGLALGGTIDNVVVLSDSGVLGTPLRWPDEFVRHKAGDLLGDLALLGGRLRAHIVATRPSHRGNVALARRLERTARRHGDIAMDIGRILEVLPHRYPFLLVDRIVEVEADRRIVGIKNVTINEPFFQGHFPGHPIMPGVLIVEAMAQVGGVLLLGGIEQPETKVVYFMSLDKVKFRRPVVPGDQLRLELEVLQNRGRTCRMQGMAYVDGQLAAEAEMMARVVER